MIDILDELLGYVSDSVIILYVSLVAVILSVITHFIFRRHNRFIKYLPGIFIMILGIYNLYTVLDSLVENESLSELMSFVTYVVSGFVGIFTAWILGIYEKPRKRRKKKENNETKKEQTQKT